MYISVPMVPIYGMNDVSTSSVSHDSAMRNFAQTHCLQQWITTQLNSIMSYSNKNQKNYALIK